MKKEHLIKKVLTIEIIGFSFILLIIWLDELIDLPHILFGASATPPNYSESTFESILIIFVAAITIALTHAILLRLRFLEGLLPICSICKKIRSKQDWIPIEQYISTSSNTDFTHGICPICAEEHYGKIMND
jgi:hypothetical protein